jgi:RNA polymerase sigma-B factor
MLRRPHSDPPSHQGRQAAREAAIQDMAGLVRAIARRYETSALPREDLAQVGYIGLIQAVDRFDPSRGVPLRAYAARMIEGEIMHALRDQSWTVRMPRGLQEASRRAARSRDRLAQVLGRAATVEEIAHESGMTPEAVREGLDALRALNARRALDTDEHADDEVPGGAVIASEDPGFEAAIADQEFRDAMRCLSPRDQEVLRLRIFEDLTQAEIAARIGVSQMHVSRILRSAGRVVREQLAEPA